MEQQEQQEAPAVEGRWIADLLIAALVCAAFAPAVLSMSVVWSSVDYYSHGYLVPLVALWMGYTFYVHHSRSVPSEPNRLGLIGILIAGALEMIGIATSAISLQGLALVLGVASAIVALRGTRWLKELSFPVAYLLFMIPLPEMWVTPIIVRLQLIVSEFGVWALQLARYPVYRDGNTIQLPGGDTLFVADACSGITSIITLIPLAVLLAYFTERTTPRRLILVAAVIPLGMAGNLTRVIGTVIAALHYGAPAATEGPVHESAGLLTYVFGCLALLGVGWLMRKLVPESPPATRAAA